jgi:hypothetical protein
VCCNKVKICVVERRVDYPDVLNQLSRMNMFETKSPEKQCLSPTSNLSSCMLRTIKYLLPIFVASSIPFPSTNLKQSLLVCRLTVDTSTALKLALNDGVNVHSKSGARSVGFAAGVSVNELVDSLAILVGFGADVRGIAVGRLVDELDVEA